MKDLTKKQIILYFVLGCIPLRLFIVLLTYYTPVEYLKYIGVLFLLQSIGFLYLFFSNKRLSAPESGGKTWWAPLRLIHGFLYMAASIYAFRGERFAWIPLSLDVLFGLGKFVNYRLLNNTI